MHYENDEPVTPSTYIASAIVIVVLLAVAFRFLAWLF